MTTRLVLSAAILLLVAAAALADDVAAIEFIEVGESESITRDATDDINAVVVHDWLGLVDFLEKYPSGGVDVPEDFFRTWTLVIGFSEGEGCFDVGVDGFKQHYFPSPLETYYTLDLHRERPCEYIRMDAPEGKKYSEYCAIGVPRRYDLADVRVREVVPGRHRVFGTR